MDNKKIFADRLVKLRESRGVTQQTLADDLEITRQSLSLYEKAQRTINIDLLVKIAKYFNVSTDYLLGLNDNATTDIELKAVCYYTGLNEKSVHLLNLLNKVKKLNISEAQPPIIDILDNMILNINDYYYKALYLLQHAINTTISPIDTPEMRHAKVCIYSDNNVNYKLIYGSEYKDFLLQKCNHLIQLLNEKIVDVMGYCNQKNESDKEFEFSIDLSDIDFFRDAEDIGKEIEPLSEICEKLIKDNEVKQNGNNNKKNE